LIFNEFELDCEYVVVIFNDAVAFGANFSR